MAQPQLVKAVDSEYDFLFKIVLLGDNYVGKSSLLDSFLGYEKSDGVGGDFQTKTINVNDRCVKLQIRDSPGQERYRAINASYLRSAHGIAVIYNVTMRMTYENIMRHIEDVAKYAEPSCVKMLIGNFCDSVAIREVPGKEAELLAKQHGYEYLETSSTQNINVNEAFVQITRAILTKKLYDHKFTILLVGDSDVGKTQLLFSDDAFNCTIISTIGLDFKIKTIDLDGKRIKLVIWDTAGQERSSTITTSYYRGAKGIMLVYCITKAKTFETVAKWTKSCQEHAAEDVELMIIGNNCHANDKREVAYERAEKFAKETGVAFMEVSAQANVNVEEAFFTLARAILAKVELKTSLHLPSNAHPQLQLMDKMPVSKSTCCLQ